MTCWVLILLGSGEKSKHKIKVHKPGNNSKDIRKKPLQ
jgi:hypothetical protein